MAENKKIATRYFDKRSVDYHKKHYGSILNSSLYPALLLRHKYILDMLGNFNGKSAIDVGCGSGEMLIDLSKRGFEVVGIDLSSSMIKYAFKILPEKFSQTLFSIADIEHLPFSRGSFDLVVCSGVIEYLAKDDLALGEISRVLRIGGIAFITVTNILTPMWLFEDIAKVTGIFSNLISLFKEGLTFPTARLHVPELLSHMALAVGLVEVERAYFHFSPFLFPYNEIFPNLSRRIGLKMEASSRQILGFMGRGCIIKFIKKDVRQGNAQSSREK